MGLADPAAFGGDGAGAAALFAVGEEALGGCGAGGGVDGEGGGSEVVAEEPVDVEGGAVSDGDVDAVEGVVALGFQSARAGGVGVGEFVVLEVQGGFVAVDA